MNQERKCRAFAIGKNSGFFINFEDGNGLLNASPRTRQAPLEGGGGLSFGPCCTKGIVEHLDAAIGEIISGCTQMLECTRCCGVGHFL